MNKKLLSGTAALLLSASLWSSPADAAVFKDVYPNEKAYEAVEEMSARGLINGFPDGTFRQNEAVTRAQSAIFVGRVQNVKLTSQVNLSFSDVSSTQAAYPYIAYYTSKDVFASSSRFYPDAKITRAEMARTIVKAFAIKGTTAVKFSDVPASHPDAVYINALAASGLTNGVGGGKFDPTGTVTRGQMAIFMLNIDNFLDAKNDAQPANDTDPVFQANATEQEIWTLVNAERKKHGLASLKLANDVSYVARIKSKDMYEKKYFSHTSPTYGSPFDMMKQFGLSYTAAGENIAYNQPAAKEVMTAWMNSPGHRANILNPNFKEIGIGAYNKYYTQMFITR